MEPREPAALTLHFSCDPDFYAMALSYQDRDRWEGDLHRLCVGWAKKGVRCECWCHSEEGERIYGPSDTRAIAPTE